MAALKINPNPTFWGTVKLTVPGESEPAEIEVEFRHKSRDAFLAWTKTSDGQEYQKVIGGIINDWRGPVDEKGGGIPYSVKALGRLLNAYPASPGEFLAAYRRELFESRSKN